MFQRKSAGKRLLSFVISFAMLVTLFPAMSSFSYASETSDNTLKDLVFAQDGKTLTNSSEELQFSFSTEGMDCTPSSKDVEFDIIANGENTTITANDTYTEDARVFACIYPSSKWVGDVKITAIRVNDLEASTNYSFYCTPYGIFDNKLNIEDQAVEKGSEFKLNFKFNGDERPSSSTTAISVYLPDMNSYDDLSPTRMTRSGNAYAAYFTIPSWWNGRVDIVKIEAAYESISSYSDEGEKPLHTFEIARNYAKDVTLKELSLTDMEGSPLSTITLDGSKTRQDIRVCADFEFGEDISPSSLDPVAARVKGPEYSETIYLCYDYDEESGEINTTYSTSIEVSSDFLSGTYTIEQLAYQEYYDDDSYEDVEIKLDNKPSFTVVNEVPDKTAPVISDLYMEYNNKKVDSVFTVEDPDNDTLEVFMEVTDDSEVTEAVVSFNSDYYIESDDDYIPTSYDIELSKVSGNLWSGEIPVDEMMHADWFCNYVTAKDKYNNNTWPNKINNAPIESLYFLNGKDAQKGEHSYQIYLYNYPINSELGEAEIIDAYTSRITSFKELGFDELPTAYEVPGAKHIGWTTGYYDPNSPIIKTIDDPIMTGDADLVLRPVYDKEIAKVYVNYYNEDGEDTYLDLLIGAELGAPSKDYYDDIEEMLGSLQHSEVYGFEEWSISCEDEFIKDYDGEDGYSYFSAYARYYNSEGYDAPEYKVTLKANGGKFTINSKNYTSISRTVKTWQKGHMSKLPKPKRTGYVFIGWADSEGCIIDDMRYNYADVLYAQWQSKSDPVPIDSFYRIDYTSSDGDEWSDEATLWYDYDDTYTTVEIPWNYKDPEVYISVTLPANPDEPQIIPIEFDENNECKKIITCESADGTKSRNYRVDFILTPYPTTPYYMTVNYRSSDGNFNEVDTEFNESNIANAVIPRSAGNVKTATIQGYNLDGTEIKTRVTLNEEGFASAQIQGSDGNKYTVNVQKETPSSSVYHTAYVSVDNGEDELFLFADIYKDFENGEATIEVPYNTLSNPKGSVQFMVDPWFSGTTVEGLNYDEEGGYYTVVETGQTEVTIPYTVIAEDGVTSEEYKVTLVEADGNNTDLYELGVYVTGTRPNDPEQETYYYLDPDEAKTEKGVTFKVPYSHNSSYVYLTYAINDFLTVKGLDNNKIKLNSNGFATTDFTVTSANGKKTQKYKVNFIRDKKGDSTKLNTYVLEWYDESDPADPYKTIEYSLADAYTDNGSVIGIPVDLFNNKISFSGFIVAEDDSIVEYNVLDQAGNINTYQEKGYIYLYPEFKESDTEALDFKVISSNGKVSKDAKITFKKIYSCDHESETDIPGYAATCSDDGAKAGAYCSDCGIITKEQEYIPAKGHAIKVEKYTKATTKVSGARKESCTECGEIIWNYSIPRISSVKLSYTSYTYNGSVKTPTVTIKDTKGNKLTRYEDYDLTYPSGRKNVGKYSIKVKFKGDYYGSYTISFKINPKSVGISKLTKAKKSFKVSWSKPSSTYRKQMTGYQIRYSTKSSMSSAKTVTVKSTTATSKTIKSLKAKKKYYVQLRTYKKIGSSYYYSAWSSKKSVTTK